MVGSLGGSQGCVRKSLPSFKKKQSINRSRLEKSGCNGAWFESDVSRIIRSMAQNFCFLTMECLWMLRCDPQQRFLDGRSCGPEKRPHFLRAYIADTVSRIHKSLSIAWRMVWLAAGAVAWMESPSPPWSNGRGSVVAFSNRSFFWGYHLRGLVDIPLNIAYSQMLPLILGGIVE